MTACPSCAAPLPTRNPGIVVTVCEYCGCAVTWDADAARDSGTTSRLPQGFTRLYTGAEGSLRGRRFKVLGRIRYSYGKGFWDEWALWLEDEEALHWLTEDDHELSLEGARGRMSVAELSVGDRFTFNKQSFLIEEVGEAECVGLEGQLPRDIVLGERYRYADGSSPNGRYTVGVEYDEDEAAVYSGVWLSDKDLVLDDEGLDW